MITIMSTKTRRDQDPRRRPQAPTPAMSLWRRRSGSAGPDGQKGTEAAQGSE